MYFHQLITKLYASSSDKSLRNAKQSLVFNLGDMNRKYKYNKTQL